MMSGWSPPAASADKFPHRDTAETFAESSLTVGHSQTDVAGESVELGYESGNVTDTEADDGSTSWGNYIGVKINPNETLEGVLFEVSANTSGLNSARLQVDSDGTTLVQKDVSSNSAGDIIPLIPSGTLSAGTVYRVLLDADTEGQVANAAYPYSGTALDITDGSTQDGSSRSSRENIRSVRGAVPATSGTATLEWPTPADAFAWGHATFQRTLAGETVTVDVEETSDGGSTWTTVATNISRGYDISAADAANNVRLVANLSRSDTTNNPTLDFAARSYTQ